MAANLIPIGQTERVQLAQAELGGIISLGAEIGLSVVTEAAMQAAISNFERCNSLAKQANSIKDEFQTALEAARNEAIELAGAVKRWLIDAPDFGPKPNAQWQEVGFAPGSLFIERKNIELLLGNMANFLLTHPQYENIVRGVTGENCAQKAGAIPAARSDLASAKTDYAARIDQQNAAFDALRKLMSALLQELKLRLADDDARYYAFGLKRPADVEAPDAPRDLSVENGAAGAIFAQWAPARRAARYHVFLGLNGEEPARIATVSHPEWLGRDLIFGATAQIFVKAVNDGGESRASEVKEIEVK